MSKSLQTVSIVPGTTPAVTTPPLTSAAAPTCKTKFLSCLKAAAPLLEGAIAIGTDAASEALRAQIQRDGKLNAAQKDALTNLSTDMLHGITTSVKTQISAQLATVDADPTATALIAAASATGVIDAFAPGLMSAAARVATGEQAVGATQGTFILPNIVTPASKFQAAAKAAAKAKGPVVVDLSHASATVTLGDKDIAKMVEQAIKDSGLPKLHQKNLISSGAAVTFVHSLIEQSNKTIIDASHAARATLDPSDAMIAPLADGTLVDLTAAAGTGLASLAVTGGGVAAALSASTASDLGAVEGAGDEGTQVQTGVMGGDGATHVDAA